MNKIMIALGLKKKRSCKPTLEVKIWKSSYPDSQPDFYDWARQYLKPATELKTK